jgi:hypothetical protein
MEWEWALFIDIQKYCVEFGWAEPSQQSNYWWIMELRIALSEQYIVEETICDPICSQKNRELPRRIKKQSLLIFIIS